MAYDVSIIIPFLNESENLKIFLPKLSQYLSNRKDLRCETIFVDDGSSDDSIEIIKKFKIWPGSLQLIKLSKNYGSHAALRAGFYHARGECCTHLATDMQEPIDLVGRLYDKIQKGYNIVFACRESIQVSLVEKFFSRLYAKIVKKMVTKDYPEKGLDLVMFDHKVRKALNDDIEANSSIFLQILMLGFKQASISYHKNVRKQGKSKWTLARKVKVVIDSIVAFSYSPVRFVSIMGILFSSAGFLWMIYVAVRTFLYHNLAPGWPALLAILMIGFGITNISLGIIAEYLWRTLDVSRNRKVFIIDKIVKLN